MLTFSRERPHVIAATATPTAHLPGRKAHGADVALLAFRRIQVNPQDGFTLHALFLTRHRRLASAVSMIAELTDLDRIVIDALSARYACGGEAAFDEAVSRLVIALCAVLAHTRGPARLRDLINLVEAVSAASGKRVRPH